jgi:hypothetical protein
MINAFKSGLRLTLRNWRMNLVVYAFNIGLTLIVALALRGSLSGELATRNISPRMLQGFDVTVLADFLYAQANLSQLFGIAFSVLLFYLVFSVFISGGVLGVLRQDLKQDGTFSLSQFFGDSGKYAMRFAVLFGLFLAALLVPILGFAAFAIAASVIDKSATSEIPLATLYFVGLGVALVLFAYVQMIFDYAKFVVVEKNEKAFNALAAGIKVVFKNFLTVSGIYVLCVVVLAAVMLAYFALNVDANSAGKVAAVFFLQQILIVGRVFCRTLFLASELSFYESRPTPAAKPDMVQEAINHVGQKLLPTQEPPSNAPPSADDATPATPAP